MRTPQAWAGKLRGAAGNTVRNTLGSWGAGKERAL